MNVKRWFPVPIMLVLVATSACNTGIPFPSTSTPTPTNTPMPTDTPIPTATGLPTHTPTPEPVPGFDIPVSVGKATLRFEKVTIQDKLDLDSKNFAKPGYAVLLLSAASTGNVGMEWNKVYLQPFIATHDQTAADRQFYIDDGSDAKEPWKNWHLDPPTNTFYILFYVKKDAKSYVLYNVPGTPWSADLTHRIEISSPSLTETSTP